MEVVFNSLVQVFPYAGAIVAIYLLFRDSINTNTKVASSTSTAITGLQTEVERLQNRILGLENDLEVRDKKLAELNLLIEQLRRDWERETAEINRRLKRTYDNLKKSTNTVSKQMVRMEKIFQDDRESEANRLQAIEKEILNFSVNIKDIQKEIRKITAHESVELS